MTIRYENPKAITKEETIQILNSGASVEQKVSAIVGAISSIKDHAWLTDLCLSYMGHEDKWIAGAAINGLGDIARVFGQLDSETILKQLDILKSKRSDLAGKIEDAVDDIKMFIG